MRQAVWWREISCLDAVCNPVIIQLPSLEYRLLMKNSSHFPWENEAPESLVSRIHDHLETEPAPSKQFDIEQRLLLSPSLSSKYHFCPAWSPLAFSQFMSQ